MGIGINVWCDLSMHGPHHARRLHPSHLHAHLPTLEFDEDGPRAQGFPGPRCSTPDLPGSPGPPMTESEQLAALREHIAGRKGALQH